MDAMQWYAVGNCFRGNVELEMDAHIITTSCWSGRVHRIAF